MDFKTNFYPESKFGGFTDIDGTIAFYTRINALLTPSSVVLDFGCGRGAYSEDPVALRRNLHKFKGKVQKVIGLDVDKAAESHPYLDEFHLLTDSKWPIPDNSIDLCVCDYVMEHLKEPESFFPKLTGFLKMEGTYVLEHQNSWGYIALFSRLIPEGLHTRVLARAQTGRKEEDIFTTFYRGNSIPVLRRMLNTYGFNHIVYGYGAEPAYFSFSKIAFWLGTLYQKLAPGVLQPTIFVFANVHKSDSNH